MCDLTKIGFGYSYLTKEFVLDDLNNGSLVEMKTDFALEKRDIGIVLYSHTHIPFASRKLIDLILKNN